MKAAVLFFMLILANAVSAQTCILEGESFEIMAAKFSEEWTGQPSACQSERFERLNDWITGDMRSNPAQYNQRLLFVTALPDGDSKDYLVLSFQEAWFYIFINDVMDKEYWRTLSKLWDPKVLIGMAGAAGLLLHPNAKSFRTKAIRYFTRGLGIIFDGRRAVYFAASLNETVGGAIVKKDKEEKEIIQFVKPPLFFLDKDEARYDQRTDNIFVDNAVNDLFEVTAGAVVSTIGGVGASHAANRFGMASWDRWSEKAPLLKTKIFKIVNPSFLIGLGATVLTTKISGVSLSDYRFDHDFKKLRKGLRESLSRLREAIQNENQLGIWLESRRIRNTLILDRHWLIGNLSPGLWDLSEKRSRMVHWQLSHCLSDRAQVMKRNKAEFFKAIENEVAEFNRQLLASRSLFQETGELLAQNPDAKLKNLREFVDAGIKGHDWTLKSELSANGLWTGIEAQFELEEIVCLPPQSIDP